MLSLNVERDDKKLENKKETFSSSGCYNKDWVLLTNKPQKLSTLVCCICKQIANNAVELHCDEHENAEQVHLVGEECLQMYLKQNNDKCPIQQHDHCEFSKSKTLRQQGQKQEKKKNMKTNQIGVQKVNAIIKEK
ncbi:hypothetical protein RFI_12652 [Reticulomyxa filosa]|uniref:Uncharacterized protein n=1 Tax=Reticulomyxa filosa TaxID=46433 RepID=X6NDV6_RETFI|nr:hypothetical protein RFI_12652 [Reticulomyxa filosa]|eukprot:ETO24505.1 hypothetical protein RFI_12652 [Reticulomyxa filosa]